MSDNLPKGDPQGYFVVLPADRASDSVNLRSLIRTVWEGKYWVIASVLLFGGIAGVHAKLTEPVYRSSTVLAVRTEDMGGALSSLRGQLGGIASLAGIGLGQGGRKREEFIAFLRSPGLVRAFVENSGIMQVMYEERWNPATKTFSLDANGNPPSVGEAALQFSRRALQVGVEERTGLVSVDVSWTDRHQAAEWANAYVALANELLRGEAMRSADQSIGFLNEELAKTNVEPIRQSLFRLLEGRLNDKMLATVERQYAFKVIDPAVASEPRRFVRPRPVLQTLIGILCGGAFGLLFVLWRPSERTKEKT